MMAQSPQRVTPSPKSPNECFSPIILPASPAELVNQKNITGLPRVIRDIAADIYNNIQKWNGKHITGAAIVQQIAIIKSQASEQLPAGLEEHIKLLYEVVQSMEIICTALAYSQAQISSLVKLQKENGPIFMMLSMEQIAKLVQDIVSAYETEFKAKEYVLENIAYTRTKQEVMFFSANWAYQIYVTGDVGLKLEQLLTETGHRRIT